MTTSLTPRAHPTKALTGTGVEFRKMAEALVAEHRAHDRGVGHAFLGGFFLVAPWPLGDKARALGEFEEAAGQHPSSKRNAYNLCVGAYKNGQFARAEQLSRVALGLRCEGATEHDYCHRLDSEAARVGAMAAKLVVQ